jgi:hypothetical protein
MGGIEGGFSGMNRILPGEPSIFNRESKKVDINDTLDSLRTNKFPFLKFDHEGKIDDKFYKPGDVRPSDRETINKHVGKIPSQLKGVPTTVQLVTPNIIRLEILVKAGSNESQKIDEFKKNLFSNPMKARDGYRYEVRESAGNKNGDKTVWIDMVKEFDENETISKLEKEDQLLKEYAKDFARSQFTEIEHGFVRKYSDEVKDHLIDHTTGFVSMVTYLSSKPEEHARFQGKTIVYSDPLLTKYNEKTQEYTHKIEYYKAGSENKSYIEVKTDSPKLTADEMTKEVNKANAIKISIKNN